MSRYQVPQSTPVQPTFEGDERFTSVNMKLDRAQLEPGTLALSVNKRLRNGIAETRPGIWPPPVFNLLQQANTSGFGVYADPNGEERLLVADSQLNQVYSFRDNEYPQTIPVSKPLGADIEFVQAGAKIYLFQGKDKVQQVWDGQSLDGFVEITKSDPLDTETLLIPPAVTAEHLADRLLVIKDTNSVIVSDILDYTSYDPLLSVFYINGSGGDSPINRVFGYAKGMALVFSPRAITLFLNFTGDPSLASVELLNSNLGLVGRKAVVMLGGDVLFLSDPGGIYRVAQAFENRLQTIPLPITDPIQPFIDRINWRAAIGAVAATVGEYVYFAVPIDDSTVNNAVIVYNGATSTIEGYDTFPTGFQIDDFTVAQFMGERRLLALDKALARIYVMYEGRSDFVAFAADEESLLAPITPFPTIAAENQIDDVIETRGYATLGWNSASRRDFKRVEIGVSTWNPSMNVVEITDSAGDERPLNQNPILKDRTEYDVFARPTYDHATRVPDPEHAGNTKILYAGDWALPGRQDYSVPVDDINYVVSSPTIDPGRKQASTLRFATKARGRSVSFRLSNSQGRCDVLGCRVESTGLQRELRRAG